MLDIIRNLEIMIFNICTKLCQCWGDDRQFPARAARGEGGYSRDEGQEKIVLRVRVVCFLKD